MICCCGSCTSGGTVVQGSPRRLVGASLPSMRAGSAWGFQRDPGAARGLSAKMTLCVPRRKPGCQTSEVAIRIGRPVEAIWRRRRRLGLAAPAPRTYSAADDQTLRLALSAGRNSAEIAATLGRSRAAVRLRARESGLVTPRKRRPWSAEEDAVVRQGYADGPPVARSGPYFRRPGRRARWQPTRAYSASPTTVVSGALLKTLVFAS
jgi:hypothetical protein